MRAFSAKQPYAALTPSLAVRAIISANAALFAVSLVFSGKAVVFSVNPFEALSPSPDVLNFLGASGRIPIDRFHAWWSLIAANWLHGSLLHILFNMLALRTVAPLVMAEYGISRMFTIYTLSGALGFFMSYLGNIPLTIGASAGLCGLIGSLLYFGRSRGGPWGRQVYRQMSGWIVSLIIIGFLLPGINNWGHGGGLAGGIALGFLLGYNDRRRENTADRMLALILAVITVLVLARPVAKGVILIFG